MNLHSYIQYVGYITVYDIIVIIIIVADVVITSVQTDIDLLQERFPKQSFSTSSDQTSWRRYYPILFLSIIRIFKTFVFILLGKRKEPELNKDNSEDQTINIK